MSGRPNFFLVGAAKSGTTALADALSQHPQIYMSAIKEPYYYCEQPLMTDGQYEAMFRGAESFAIRGEATTGYLYDPSTASRIIADCPDARIAMILRNPVDMAFSFWQFMQTNGSEHRSFPDALKDIDGDTLSNPAGRSENYLYVRRARYAPQVHRFLDTFGHDRCHIMIYDDYRSDAEGVLEGLFQFLGVDPTFTASNRNLNSGATARSRFAHKLIHRNYPLLKACLPPEWRRKLRSGVKRMNRKVASNLRLNSSEKKEFWQYFETDVADLSRMIGREDLTVLWRPSQEA